MQKYLFILLLLVFSCEETLEPEDCAGVAGGNAFIDFCGVCVSIIDNVIDDSYVNLCEGSSEN